MKYWLSLCYLFLYSLLFIPFDLESTPFVTAHLVGQFGNQLFIMAAAISLALDHGVDYTFPDLVSTTAHPLFNIPYNYEKVFYHINAWQPQEPISYHYREPQFTYSPIPFRPNMKLHGWYQSEKYFLNHKQEIINLYSPHPEIVDYLYSKYQEIINHPNTVSIHYRSYLKEDPEQKVYLNCGVEYYKKAISLFPESTLFVVFSNQMDWCKKNLAHLAKNIRFIEGENYIYDFYLMSLCKHNIICNSTFSWWAAYLNKNPNKVVIAPPIWFSPKYKHDDRDLIPADWHILR